MSRIYWDSMLFIYWIEDHPKYARRVGHIFDRMVERRDILCTSTFTVAEVLAGPCKCRDDVLAQRVRRMFETTLVETLPFTLSTAEVFASIRGPLGLSPLDTIHLATASEAKADLFLTNDAALIGKAIPGIHFVAGIDTDLF